MKQHFFLLLFTAACGGATAEAQVAPNVQAMSAPPPTASTTAGDEGGTHLSIGSIDADGVRLADLSCDHVQGGVAGGIFGGIALAAGFKTRKTKLGACSATVHLGR